jgi:hypothetical protein
MGSDGEADPRYPSQDFVIIRQPGSKRPRPPASSILKTIIHPSAQRRVQIIRRPDGLFSYDEEELVMAYLPELAETLKDYRTVWVPVKHDVSIFESSEAAENAARGAVAWLAEV